MLVILEVETEKTTFAWSKFQSIGWHFSIEAPNAIASRWFGYVIYFHWRTWNKCKLTTWSIVLHGTRSFEANGIRYDGRFEVQRRKEKKNENTCRLFRAARSSSLNTRSRFCFCFAFLLPSASLRKAFESLCVKNCVHTSALVNASNAAINCVCVCAQGAYRFGVVWQQKSKMEEKRSNAHAGNLHSSTRLALMGTIRNWSGISRMDTAGWVKFRANRRMCSFSAIFFFKTHEQREKGRQNSEVVS